MIRFVPDGIYLPRVKKLPKLNIFDALDLRAPWRERTKCNEYRLENPEAPNPFTEDHDVKLMEKGLKLCSACRVSDICLASALADDKAQGLRGGLMFIMGGLDEESRTLVKERYGAESRPKPTGH